MAAVGSCTRTTQRNSDGYQVTLAWTADASGDMAEGGTTGKAKFTATGFLHSYETQPGAGAADDYDITLLDSDGLDVLRAQGINQQQLGDQTCNTKYRSNVLNADGGYMYFFGAPLTLTIAGGGNLGTGVVKLKFSRSQL